MSHVPPRRRSLFSLFVFVSTHHPAVKGRDNRQIGRQTDRKTDRRTDRKQVGRQTSTIWKRVYAGVGTMYVKLLPAALKTQKSIKHTKDNNASQGETGGQRKRRKIKEKLYRFVVVFVFSKA